MDIYHIVAELGTTDRWVLKRRDASGAVIRLVSLDNKGDAEAVRDRLFANQTAKTAT